MPFGKTNKTRRQLREAREMQTFHEKFIAGLKSAQAYAKFWVAVLGALLAIIATELPIPDEVTGWIVKGIAIVTAFSVYAFPNSVPPVE